MQDIALAEVIQHLRSELQTAIDARGSNDLRFAVQDIELEVQVGVTKEAKVEGSGETGVKFWVIGGKAGGKVEGSYQASQIHRVKLSLKPETAKGTGVHVDSTVDEFPLPGDEP